MFRLFLLFFLTLLVFEKNVLANEDASLPAGFRLETVAEGLGFGTGFAFTADNRIFVSTKDGLVRVVQDGVLQATPFIDIRAIVNDSGDRGLTDVAVHPQFPEQPYIFIAYVFDPPEIAGLGGLAAPDARGRRVARVTRLTADSRYDFNRALPGSELHIVGTNSTYEMMGSPDKNRDQGDIACEHNGTYVRDCLPSDDYSHVVGSLHFAKDGSLYVGYGDGSTVAPYPLALSLRALDLDSMAGKILRVNPETGQGYIDNPFYDGDPDSNRSKVINYGLRNPYGFTVDPVSNKVYMGDTGWTTWEELNEGRGKNFGWPCYEGGLGVSKQQQSYAGVCADYLSSTHNVTPALYAYEHADRGGAIAGVEIYQGENYPEEYKGAVFFNDFVRSEIIAVALDDGRFKKATTFATDWLGVSKIRSGPDENLYLMDLFEGRLSRLVYGAAEAQKPVARIAADPFYGPLPLQVSFSGLGSSDPLGSELSYYWTFGDGQSSSSATPQHLYQIGGSFEVVLQVTSAAGLSDSAEFTVYAGKSVAQIEFVTPLAGASYAAGDEVRFEVSVSSSDPSFEAAKARYDWRANVIGSENQLLSLQLANNFEGSLSFPELQQGDLVSLCLLVTTADGLPSERCIDLQPEVATLSLQSEPSGLLLTLNGKAVTTPHKELVHVGARVALSSAENKGYEFSSWSDSSTDSDTQTITIPQAGLAITAVFAKKGGGSGAFGAAMLILLLLLGLFYQARYVREVRVTGAEKRT